MGYDATFDRLVLSPSPLASFPKLASKLIWPRNATQSVQPMTDTGTRWQHQLARHIYRSNGINSDCMFKYVSRRSCLPVAFVDVARIAANEEGKLNNAIMGSFIHTQRQKMFSLTASKTPFF